MHIIESLPDSEISVVTLGSRTVRCNYLYLALLLSKSNKHFKVIRV